MCAEGRPAGVGDAPGGGSGLAPGSPPLVWVPRSGCPAFGDAQPVGRGSRGCGPGGGRLTASPAQRGGGAAAGEPVSSRRPGRGAQEPSECCSGGADGLHPDSARCGRGGAAGAACAVGPGQSRAEGRVDGGFQVTVASLLSRGPSPGCRPPCCPRETAHGRAEVGLQL